MSTKNQGSGECNENGISLVNQTLRRKFVYGLKALRNFAIKSIYEQAKHTDSPGILSQLESSSLDSIVVTIAYNTPWTISLLVDCWQKYCVGTILLVVDNSSKGLASQEIRKICSNQDILYLRLPHNREWHPSRSHGLALNWIWKNILSRLTNLTSIGFIDHDCYPIRAWNPHSQPYKVAYGLKSPGWIRNQPTWSLWAGYMFFRSCKNQKVTDLDMDFTPNPLDGLDTGGMNWRTLYRKLNSKEYGYSKIEKIRLCDLLNNPDLETTIEAELIDSTFLHLGGAAYKAAWNDIGSTRIESFLRDSLISSNTTLSKDRQLLNQSTPQDAG